MCILKAGVYQDRKLHTRFLVRFMLILGYNTSSITKLNKKVPTDITSFAILKVPKACDLCYYQPSLQPSFIQRMDFDTLIIITSKIILSHPCSKPCDLRCETLE